MTVMVYWQAAHNTDYGKGRMRKGALLCSAVCCIDRVRVVKIVPLASFFHVDERNSLYISWFIIQNPLHDEKRDLDYYVKIFHGSNLQF